MADPITILTTVGTSIKTCYEISNTIAKLVRTYKSAQSTIDELSHECDITITVLSRLEDLLQNKPGILKAHENQRDLTPSFDHVTREMDRTVAKLAASLTQLSERMDKSRIWTKFKFMWEENDIKDLAARMRRLRENLSMVISAIQT
jgi:ribosome-associated translation inhibitor RaiA